MPTLGDLLYRAVDGTFAVDGKQRIIYWDPGCEELFNHSSQWVLGRLCCDVMRGMSPASGSPFCRSDCCVARLAHGAEGPKSFALQVHGDKGQQLTVFVNIVLLPSPCKRGWIVMHLLHLRMSPDVLTALDDALRPEQVVSPMGNAVDIGQAEGCVSRLTAREQEVLQLLAEGVPRRVISKRLLISPTTVGNHIQHIQNKLGVHSQAEAVAYAYRHSFVH